MTKEQNNAGGSGVRGSGDEGKDSRPAPLSSNQQLLQRVLVALNLAMSGFRAHEGRYGDGETTVAGKRAQAVINDLIPLVEAAASLPVETKAEPVAWTVEASHDGSLCEPFLERKDACTYANTKAPQHPGVRWTVVPLYRSPEEPAEELFDRYPVGTLFQKKSDGRVLAMTPDDGVTHEARAPEKASGKHDSSCVYYYGKPCDCGAENGEPKHE